MWALDALRRKYLASARGAAAWTDLTVPAPCPSAHHMAAHANPRAFLVSSHSAPRSLAAPRAARAPTAALHNTTAARSPGLPTLQHVGAAAAVADAEASKEALARLCSHAERVAGPMYRRTHAALEHLQVLHNLAPPRAAAAAALLSDATAALAGTAQLAGDPEALLRYALPRHAELAAAARAALAPLPPLARPSNTWNCGTLLLPSSGAVLFRLERAAATWAHPAVHRRLVDGDNRDGTGAASRLMVCAGSEMARMRRWVERYRGAYRAAAARAIPAAKAFNQTAADCQAALEALDGLISAAAACGTHAPNACGASMAVARGGEGESGGALAAEAAAAEAAAATGLLILILINAAARQLQAQGDEEQCCGAALSSAGSPGVESVAEAQLLLGGVAACTAAEAAL